MRGIFDALDDAILVADLDAKFVLLNPSAKRMFARGGAAPSSWAEIDGLYLADRETACPAARHPFERTARGENVWDDVFFLSPGTGDAGDWIAVSGRPLRRSGAVAGSVVICRDISDRYHVQEELGRFAADNARQAAILDSILEAMGEPVTVADAEGLPVLFNSAAQGLFGQPAAASAELHGFFLPDGRTMFPQEDLPISRGLRGEAVDNIEVFVRNERLLHGAWYSVSARPLVGADGVHRGGVAVFHDITHRKHLEDQLKALALVDELTGLYNRRGFLTIASDRLRVAQREKKRLTMLLADVDGLKQINDGLGHAAGDAAIRLAASILKESFRESDVVARLGGDEFVALFHSESEATDSLLRSRLYDAISVRLATAPAGFPFSMSIGLQGAEGFTDLVSWMARADEAMYAAKRGRRLTPPPDQGAGVSRI